MIESGIDVKKVVEYVKNIVNYFGKVKVEKKFKDELMNVEIG